MKLEGIVKNLSNEAYHADTTSMSSSNLKMLLKDLPKFHKERILGIKEERGDNSAFSEGSLAHSMVLEPHLTDSEFAFFPGWRKQGNDWEQFKLANPGKTLLSEPQRVKVQKLVDAYHKSPIAKELISGCEYELSLFTSLYDVPIKVRADAINVERSMIIDLKTTAASTGVDEFRYVVEKLSYQLSAALYCEAYGKYYGREFDFYFIVLSKKDITCRVYKLSEDSKKIGSDQVHEALSIYKKRIATNEWTVSLKRDIMLDKFEEIEEV